MSREQTQDAFFRGGKVGEYELGPLTRGRLRTLQERVFQEGDGDEERILDAAFYVYAHEHRPADIRGGDQFWKDVEEFADSIPVADLLAFKDIFAADLAAIEASSVSPIDAGKPEGEPSPTPRQSSPGQPDGPELVTVNSKR